MLTPASQNVQPKYMIVSRAQDGMWENYYGKDTKKHPMPRQSSAYFTLAGSAAKIKQQYDSVEDAEIDMKKIKQINPSGGYGICQIDFDSHEKPYLHYETKLFDAVAA